MALWAPVLTAVLALMAQKTQAQVYVIEGYFVTDYEAVMSYVRLIPGTASFDTKKAQALASMNKDIDYILTEVNQILSTLSANGLVIELRLRKLDILNTNVIPGTSLYPGVPNAVDSGTALNSFQSWLNQQNAYSTLNYDLAILWTGYDLYGSSSIFTAGYAHVGAVCDSKKSTGVVEFNGTYGTATVTAHEIAHILGAEHGGAASKHVMTSYSAPDNAKRWFFSQCSATDIKDYLATLSPNCLLTTSSSSTKPSTTYGSYTGSMLDPDAICQRSLNTTATYMCRANELYSSSTPSGDKVCSQIFCAQPGTSYCSSAYASEGMVCDASKRCNDGKCIPDTSAPANVNPKCLWGDQKLLELFSLGFTGNCTTFLAKYGSSSCYNDAINQRCCASCKPYYTGRVGCEYGDKSTDCGKYAKSAVCPQYKTSMCCNYCYGFVSKRSTKQDRPRGKFDVLLFPTLGATAVLNVTQYPVPFEGTKSKGDNSED
ncbi:unnamed protein product [Lymnaea stagnalis]|uniref:Peptidase M12B domain-containing protein n=1 Tax=Lymnaea stagnalis TaxID=6523 RepID=A0AAV2IGG1_LYMST